MTYMNTRLPENSQITIDLKGSKNLYKSIIASVIILLPGLISAIYLSSFFLFLICSNDGVKFIVLLIFIFDKKAESNLG